MKMMKRLLALVMMLVVCCTLTACKKEEAAPAAAPEATAAVTAGNPDDVLVTVGTETITRAEFDDYLTTINTYYTNSGYDVTDPVISATLKYFALQTSIEYAVMDQKVIELGLTLSEDEKAAAIAEAKAQWDAVVADGLNYYGITEESSEADRKTTTLAVLAELESMGYTEESQLSDAVKYAGYDKLYAEVTKEITKSDEEIISYYNDLVEADKALYENDAAAYEQAQMMNQMYAMYGMADYATPIYYKPAGYRLVTHILLEADEELLNAYAELQASYEEQQNTLEEGGEVTGDLITADEVENARLAILNNVQPKVDEINQKLAEGKTFAELIPEYTTDPGMKDELSISTGYEVHMDSTNWVIPFRDQAFTVNNIGDVTAPVVTEFGVHILQYVGDVAGGAMELTEEMKEEFRTALTQSAKDSLYYSEIDKWIADVNPVLSEEAQAIKDEAAAVSEEGEETAETTETTEATETTETTEAPAAE